MELYTHKDKDGLTIEFADEQRRLGIVLGKESGWYYISKDGHTQLEPLPGGLVEAILSVISE